jgi:hypothetical protein
LRLHQLLFDFKRRGAKAAVAGAEQPGIDAAVMLDRADAVSRQAQRHALAEDLARERTYLQIRFPAPARFVVRVADIVAIMRFLAADGAYFRHIFSRGLAPAFGFECWLTGRRLLTLSVGVYKSSEARKSRIMAYKQGALRRHTLLKSQKM